MQIVGVFCIRIIMKKFKLLLPIIFTIFTVALFSLNTDVVGSSVKESMKLCYNSVIPSLLPFFILCDFLLKLIPCFNFNSSIVAFTVGLISGFPTGTKNVCSLYQSGNLDRKSATSLLYCTANASPAYVITFIGSCIIKSKQAGIILLISQYISAIICFIILGKRKKTNINRCANICLTESVCLAITQAVKSCIYICGYIIFFRIFADIILSYNILTDKSKPIVIGFIEISKGLSLIDYSDKNSLIAASFILAFSGISVIMQCINETVRCGLSYKPIIIGKIIYMAIMPVTVLILQKIWHSINLLLFIVFIITSFIIINNIFDKSKSRLYNK